MGKIRIAVVGYGGMGEYHCKSLIPRDKFDIAGVYDIDGNRRAAAAKDGLRVFGGKEEIASASDCEAVLIATPNDSHAEYVEYFAAAGKHVICEKPVALSSVEYERMIEASAAHGVVFAVHQNRRWDADFLTVKNLFDTGRLGDPSGIGRILRIESRVQGGNGIPGDWRKFKEKGGGMMLDWGVHLIDQAVVMLGKPNSVYCSYSFAQGFDVDDGFKLTAEYDGVVVEITVYTDCYIKTPRWIVYGENGTAVIEDWDLNGKTVKPVFSPERKIAGIKAGNGFTKTMAYRTADSLVEEDLPRIYPEPDVFYNEFYAAVQHGAPLSVKPEQVMTVMKIMEAAERSARTHESVEL